MHCIPVNFTDSDLGSIEKVLNLFMEGFLLKSIFQQIQIVAQREFFLIRQYEFLSMKINSILLQESKSKPRITFLMRGFAFI